MEPKFPAHTTSGAPMANTQQIELFPETPQESDEDLRVRIDKDYKGMNLIILSRESEDPRIKKIAEDLIAEQREKDKEDPRKALTNG